MLHIIGIGARKEHITQEMIECMEQSKKVYIEYYTSFYETSFEELKEHLKLDFEIIDREVVESKAEEILLKPAKNEDISLLILGDPLIATTHTDLILRAKEDAIKLNIINNVSIGNFIAKTGLQWYKFGKTTSIPFFTEKFKPRTPYIVYLDNHRIGAHTLFLLDLNPSNDVANKGHDLYLTASKSLKFLLEIPNIMLEEEEIEEKDSLALDDTTPAILCSRLGMKDEVIHYGTIEELISLDEKLPLPAPVCLIIPGDMHEMEVKFLEQFKIIGSKVGEELEE